jgi:hypothetical protein
MKPKVSSTEMQRQKRKEKEKEKEQARERTVREEDLDTILDYSLNIDFSRLVTVLKETIVRERDNAEEMAVLREELQSLKEDKEATQRKFIDFAASLEQTSVLIP